MLARAMALAEYGTYKQRCLLAQTLALVLPSGMARSLDFFVPRAESRRPCFGQTLGFLLAAGVTLVTPQRSGLPMGDRALRRGRPMATA